MRERVYSVHGIVRFQIIDKNKYPHTVIDKTEIQFKNFETYNNDDKPNFLVEIGPYSRQKVKSVILDDRYFIGADYFFCKDSRKYARWEIEVSGVEDTPTIRIHTNLAGYYTVPLNIIEFFIHYLLLKKGRALIHASGVKNDKGGYIFSARGGGGKTTIALSLVERGYSYLGDNFLLVDGGKVRSYNSPLNIFSYNRLGIIERNLNNRQKLSMAFKRFIYKLTGGYIKIFEKINPSDLFFEKIVNESEISHIFFLEPNSDVRFKRPQMRVIDRRSLVKKLRYNMELDLQLFNKYMYSYSYLNTGSFWSNFWENYERVLTTSLPQAVSTQVIQVPTKYDPEIISKLIEEIESL